MAEQYGKNQRQKIILASGSPRRRELLGAMGYEFAILAPDVDENVQGRARDIVGVLAERKGRAAAGLCHDGEIVIAADTLVSLDERPRGKPKSDGEAAAMLRALSGRSHEVYTGLCVIDTAAGTMSVDVECTRVTFRPLSDEEIAAYVATGEPRDKAGAYAIQGGAAAFVSGYDGSYNNVIGLPTEKLAERLNTIMA